MKNTTQRLRHGKTLAATGLATVLAASVCAQAWADGIATAKPNGPGVRSLSALRTSTDVTVDYTVLNGLSRTPMLLIPGASTARSNDTITLRPPAGVAPVLTPPPGVRTSTSVIKLRPPPGVRVADLKPAAPAPAAAPPSAPVQMAKVDPNPEPAKPAAKPEAAKVAPASPAAPAAAPAVKPPVQAATPAKPAAPAAPPAQAAAPTPAKPAPVQPAPAAPPPAKVAVAPPAPAPAAKPAAATPPPAPKPAQQTPPAQAKVEAPKVEPAKPAAVTPPPTPKPAAPVATPAPAAAPAAPPPAAAAQAPVAAPAPGAPQSLLTPPPAEAKPAEAKTAETKPAETKPAETKVAVLPQPAAPPAQPAATPAASETKTAALAPVKKPDVPETLSISFDVGVPDVPANASGDLKTLAALIKADPALRIQLLAFASDPEKSVSRSRRLALERAVNVRKQLLDAGIDSTRIEVRALGEQSGDGPPDRVDAITSRR